MRLPAALLVASVLTLAVAPRAAHAQSPYGETWRGPWYIGFGLGTGVGSYRIQGERVNFRHAHGFDSSPLQLAYQLELGATLTRNVLLGGEVSGLTSSTSDSFADSTLSLTQVLAVVTVFPRERGVFFRGGAGFATLRKEFDDGFTFARASANGVSVLGGAGYAWWLGRHFNLTLHADVSGQKYGSGSTEPTSSAAVNAYLGFRWY
jgi:hypothetical protein